MIEIRLGVYKFRVHSKSTLESKKPNFLFVINRPIVLQAFWQKTICLCVH